MHNRRATAQKHSNPQRFEVLTTGDMTSHDDERVRGRGSNVPDLIALKDQSPVAEGGTQVVYQHPRDAGLLIKVRKLEMLQKAYDRKIGGMLGYRRQHGLHTNWMRELEHYFSVHLRLGYHPQFLQRYYGVSDTDLGLGLVVGKITDRSGGLAPILGDVAAQTGVTPQLRQEVSDLLRQLNDLRISTTDISVRNIVCGWSEAAGDHLVLIEGIGVNTFIPLARFSDYFNIRSNNRHFAKTLRSLDKIERERLAQKN
jgi:hypothetical protein